MVLPTTHHGGRSSNSASYGYHTTYSSPKTNLGADVRTEQGAWVTGEVGKWKTPTGTLAHRGDCPVVACRSDARPVTADDEFQECSICAIERQQP